MQTCHLTVKAILHDFWEFKTCPNVIDKCYIRKKQTYLLSKARVEMVENYNSKAK